MSTYNWQNHHHASQVHTQDNQIHSQDSQIHAKDNQSHAKSDHFQTHFGVGGSGDATLNYHERPEKNHR